MCLVAVDFIQSPSEAALEQCSKGQLLRIADHFNTVIGGICFEAKSEKYPHGYSIDVGISGK